MSIDPALRDRYKRCIDIHFRSRILVFMDAGSLMKPIAMTLAALSLLLATVAAKEKAEDKWFEHDAKLSKERLSDGDSFGMEIKTPKGNPTTRTYRLYGVDCPETDDKDHFAPARIKEQADWFGCETDDIPALGKEAAEFTRKLLTKGKPLIFTRGTMGEKTDKVKGRPQRYFALVEVTAEDGTRRWLHELLLEAGLARAYGAPAAWPPKEEDRNGREKAEKKFKEDLKRLENKAKREKVGAWKKGK